MPVFADATLSARLEAIAIEQLRVLIATARQRDGGAEAATEDICGGAAFYLGPGSPVNQALGLASGRTLLAGEADALEAFFKSRGQRGFVIASPFADGSLFAELQRRGWHVDGFENVLVREIAPEQQFTLPPGVEVVEAVDERSRALWAEVAAIAFAAPLEPVAGQVALSRLIAARPEARLVLAVIDGRAAGVGELSLSEEVAWLSADATLPQFRRRGVQSALQAYRLQLAASSGCSIAVSEAMPGGTSQRNMQRLGFSLAYTRLELLAPRSQA